MAFESEKPMYCDKLNHIVAKRAVCERRVLPVMQRVWPLCQGCNHTNHRIDPKNVAVRGLTTYSEPPTLWYNLPFYRLMIGEDICRDNRPGNAVLDPLKFTVSTSTNDYHGPGRVDITMKTGDQHFAPSKEMVYAYKNGKLSEEDYTQQYLVRMRESYSKFPNAWMRLISHGNVVITCYCNPPPVFCHRHLLKNMLAKVCNSLNVEFVDGGEVR